MKEVVLGIVQLGGYLSISYAVIVLVNRCKEIIVHDEKEVDEDDLNTYLKKPRIRR